jgi:uncharacterized membrane protein
VTELLDVDRAVSPPLQALTVVALLGSALVAGIFFAFSSFVMPALARLPADRGVLAMQSINITAVRPAFMSALFGTAVVCVVLLIAGARSAGTSSGVLLLIGSVLYLASAIVLTTAFHVPLNNELAAADPTAADSVALWARYLSRWGAGNQLRWIGPLGSAVLFALALRR